MISSIAWVPKGVAARSPKRYERSSTEQELLEMIEKHGDLARLQSNLVDKLEKKQQISLPKIENNLPADLRMDDYSSDEDELGDILMNEKVESPGEVEMEDDGQSESGNKVSDDDDKDDDDSDSDDDDDLADVPDTREFEPTNVEGLEAMDFAGASGTGGAYADLNGEDDISDQGDIELKEDDAVLVVAKTEEDFATLEIHVYEQRTGNLFVHHDIPLPSYPLAVAHGQVTAGGRTGNFCAVGTFSPGIEIWNLDVLNALEPTCVLGGEDHSMADDMLKLQMLSAATGKQVKKIKRPTQNSLLPGSHTDAVMALSWNGIHRQVLASGSADHTVKLWDVTRETSTTERCDSATFSHHRDKVQCLEWHPKESTLLATGSFDKTIALLDARSDDSHVKSIKIQSDCEGMAWDPFNTEHLTVLCEDGFVSCWDVRNLQTPLWTHVVNEYGGVNNLAYSPMIPGLLATCSKDAHVSIWDTYSQNNAPAPNVPPKLCMTKDMCVGKLFALQFYPSSPWLLGTGGSGNQIALWNLDSEQSLASRFDPDKRKIGTEGDVEESTAKDDDFEAMMQKDETNNAFNDERLKQTNTKSKKKKKKGKDKKKVHRKGR